MAKTIYSGPENMPTLVSVLWCILCFQRIPFKNIFDSLQLVTVTVWQRYNVSMPFTIVYILFSCPLGLLVSLWHFETIRGSLMRPKWPNVASLVQKIGTL